MMKAEVEKELWTLNEVAAYLRVSTATIRRWTRLGILPCYRPGGSGSRRLFSPQQVSAFLKKSEQDRLE
jgi:excisionase family DNA binding protein